MLDEPFARGDSPIHRLDPRYRVAMVFCFTVAVALCRHLAAPLAGLGVGVILMALARLDPLAVGRRLVAVNFFIFFLWLVLPFSLPGTPVLTLGPLTATRQGMALALLVTVKSNAVVCAFLALAATMDAPVFGQALGRLGVPPKLTFLFLFTYRYVHVLADEYSRLRVAAKLRGFHPKTGMHTYRTVANLLGMVLVRGYDRSRRVYEAMVLRGFCGAFYTLRRFSAAPRDRAFLAAMIVCLAAMAALEAFPLHF
ncbi:cobalt ECF transporter T component CbiQ [Desulfolutivibrio sp.]|uniref:cobalt ECF transporter T component CbiQ n=1 Tax=Desulfolutivibrio sp. TaxID=2773296 RepID=UPI002F963DE9